MQTPLIDHPYATIKTHSVMVDTMFGGRHLVACIGEDVVIADGDDTEHVLLTMDGCALFQALTQLGFKART